MKQFEPTVSGLNVRLGPGLQFDSVDRLNPGDVVTEAAIPPDWCPIELEDGSIGWVARQYLKEYVGPVGTPATGGEILLQRDLTAKFGPPDSKANYLATIDLRAFSQYLGHVKDFEGNVWSGKIYGHKLLEARLKKAFQLLCDRGLAGELKTYDGCFNIRRMTGGSAWSVHSWGLAVDLNASLNTYGGPVRFSREFILCFAQAGFEAGALWHTPDGMHFQLPWTQDWRNSDNPLRPLA